jgi:hypothetical protein
MVSTMAGPVEVASGSMSLADSRRRLLMDSLGIVASASGFGLVYGLSARAAGFSPLEASAMSVIVFAGASQFVAVGYVLGGFSWLAIVLLTAFLNARHLLYAAALAPYFADEPRSPMSSPTRRSLSRSPTSGASAGPTSAATGWARSSARSSRGTSRRSSA